MTRLTSPATRVTGKQPWQRPHPFVAWGGMAHQHLDQAAQNPCAPLHTSDSAARSKRQFIREEGNLMGRPEP